MVVTEASASAALIESDRVDGTAVYDHDGKHIGTIKRLMIEKSSGRVAYVVMSFGGFFALGTEPYTIPWAGLRYDKSLGGYRIAVGASELRAAPSFAQDANYNWPDREREEELHAHYRIPPYWRSI